MTKTVDVFTSRLSLKEILSLVREGAEVIFTEENTPMARITPLSKPLKPRIAGLHNGAIQISDDFDDPLPEEFWTEGARKFYSIRTHLFGGTVTLKSFPQLPWNSAEIKQIRYCSAWPVYGKCRLSFNWGNWRSTSR